MGAASDIIIFHAVPTRSCRIVWLLEELGVPYTLRAVDFPAGLTMPEYLAINPMGTCAPCQLPYGWQLLELQPRMTDHCACAPRRPAAWRVVPAETVCGAFAELR